MAASFAVLACTVLGAVLRFVFGAGKLENHETFTVYVAAFAVGCLLATAFFLLLVEASHLISARYQVEAQGTWRYGTVALAGYLLGMAASAFDPGHAHAQRATDVVAVDDCDKVEGAALVEEKKSANLGFVFGIFMSDFVHNFV